MRGIEQNHPGCHVNLPLQPYSTCTILRCLVVVLWVCFLMPAQAAGLQVLKPQSFTHHVERFNAMEDENITNYVSNAESWSWMSTNIPFFACPDRQVEETWYFRWWSFRKHLVRTTNGFVITEFLTPVSHARAYNTISSALGFHLAEGRWLHDQRYLDGNTLFWLRGNGGKPQSHLHKFSSWLAVAVYDRYLVNGDRGFVTALLDDLVADYQTWVKEQQLTNGLFWQYDVRDAMEESISGARRKKNIRPTINSYMYGNARAIAAIAQLARQKKVAVEFEKKANGLRQLTETSLWNPEAKFFEVRLESGEFADVREELGFIPWFFELPEKNKGYEVAWAQLADPEGFQAPSGITTAERRHPLFRSHGCYTCEWDGAVWPFATCQTLYALANVLRDYPQNSVSTNDYFDAFLTYARSQQQDGKPYIGEYHDEVTGQWFNGRGGRSRYYNHSTFADLVITGVVGLVPREDRVVEVHPLLPPGVWDWFCLDGVSYHGHTLAIVWDKDGTRYNLGKGLCVVADGRVIAKSGKLERITGKLP